MGNVIEVYKFVRVIDMIDSKKHCPKTEVSTTIGRRFKMRSE